MPRSFGTSMEFSEVSEALPSPSCLPIQEENLLRLENINVRSYFKTVWPVLTFAFTSRSAPPPPIPLNVKTQLDGLKVPEPSDEPVSHLRRHHSQLMRRHLPRHARGHDRPLHGHRSPEASASSAPLPSSPYGPSVLRGRGRRDLRSAGGSPSHGIPRHRSGKVLISSGTAHRYGVARTLK